MENNDTFHRSEYDSFTVLQFDRKSGGVFLFRSELSLLVITPNAVI